MSERFDAVVIGGGVNGVAAAALLAKAGRRTILLEPDSALSERSSSLALRALDPRLVKELRLVRHGLKFAARDLPLAAPGLVLGRDRHAAQRVLSAADATAYAVFRHDIDAVARLLRRSWWDGRPGAETAEILKPIQRALFDELCVTSANCFLAARFESDTLKAALAFAAAQAGAPPSEPGSALALLWAASQEMSGAQGAVAMPQAGGLLAALSAAAQRHGATVRVNAPAYRVKVEDRRVAAIELISGERIETPLVLSTRPRRDTLALAPTGLVGLGAGQARAASGAGCATLVFTLSRAPDFVKARLILAERLETYEAALASLRLDQPPRDVALEILPPPPEPGAPQFEARILLTVRAWPATPTTDRARLAAAATAAIEHHAPGFAASVTGCEILLPQAVAPATVERLLASAATRCETGIAGLYLCGEDAEPANAISGRAARHAVRLALTAERAR